MSGLIASLVQTAFGIIQSVDPDIVTPIVYTPGSSSVYDPDTGLVTNSTSPITLTSVISKFGENEIDAEVVVATDGRLLISGLSLGSITPNHTDTLVSTDINGAATTWKVVRVLGVPTNGLWKIHIRRV